MDFDWRVLIVVGPLLVAGGWAVFNIAPVAIRQIQGFLNRES